MINIPGKSRDQPPVSFQYIFLDLFSFLFTMEPTTRYLKCHTLKSHFSQNVIFVCFRQYYVATAANKPKDVVVAVDVSGVMGMRSNYESMTLFTVARMAVDDVINTLNPNDRVRSSRFSSFFCKSRIKKV